MTDKDVDKTTDANRVVTIQEYIETLVELKVTLGSISDLMDKIGTSEEKQADAIQTLATEMRLIKDKIANIELKILLANSVDIRRTGPTNGSSNDKKSKGKLPSDLEELNKKLMYEVVGKFVAKNWKFFLVLAVLAVVGAMALNVDVVQSIGLKQVVTPTP